MPRALNKTYIKTKKQHELYTKKWKVLEYKTYLKNLH